MFQSEPIANLVELTVNFRSQSQELHKGYECVAIRVQATYTRRARGRGHEGGGGVLTEDAAMVYDERWQGCYCFLRQQD